MRFVLSILLLLGSVESGLSKTAEEMVSFMMFGYDSDVALTFKDMPVGAPFTFVRQSASPLVFFGSQNDLDGSGKHRARIVSSVTQKSECEFSAYQASYFYLTLENGGVFIKDYVVNAEVDFRRVPDPEFPSATSETVGLITVTTATSCKISATDDVNRKKCAFTNFGPVDPVKAEWKKFRTEICKQ